MRRGRAAGRSAAGRRRPAGHAAAAAVHAPTAVRTARRAMNSPIRCLSAPRRSRRRDRQAGGRRDRTARRGGAGAAAAAVAPACRAGAGSRGSRDAAPRRACRADGEAADDGASTRLAARPGRSATLFPRRRGKGAVRLSHQRVLQSWTRAPEDNRRQHRLLPHPPGVEDQRRGGKSGRQHDLLIPSGMPLAEAENIRTRYAGELSREVCAYIDASSLRGRARQRRQRIAVAAFALLAVIASAAGVWALKQQQQAEDALRKAGHRRRDSWPTWHVSDSARIGSEKRSRSRGAPCRSRSRTGQG